LVLEDEKIQLSRKERIKDLAQLIRIPFDRDGEGRRFWCCYGAFTNQFGDHYQVKSLEYTTKKVFFINVTPTFAYQVLESCCKGCCRRDWSENIENFSVSIVIHNFYWKGIIEFLKKCTFDKYHNLNERNIK
jgi:hypothetical protein